MVVVVVLVVLLLVALLLPVVLLLGGHTIDGGWGAVDTQHENIYISCGLP